MKLLQTRVHKASRSYELWVFSQKVLQKFQSHDFLFSLSSPWQLTDFWIIFITLFHHSQLFSLRILANKLISGFRPRGRVLTVLGYFYWVLVPWCFTAGRGSVSLLLSVSCPSRGGPRCLITARAPFFPECRLEGSFRWPDQHCLNKLKIIGLLRHL